MPLNIVFIFLSSSPCPLSHMISLNNILSIYVFVWSLLSCLQYNEHIVFDTKALAELRAGLDLGHRMRLPSDLTLGCDVLVDLLVSDGHIQEFRHVRYVTADRYYILLYFHHLMTSLKTRECHCVNTSTHHVCGYESPYYSWVYDCKSF